MKRICMGLVILAVLLGLALLLAAFMDQTQTPIASYLRQAARAALGGDWDKAEALSHNAFVAWQRHKRLTAALEDHEPIEEMETLFAELELQLQQRQAASFAVTCNRLAQLATAIAEDHALTWWNLL